MWKFWHLVKIPNSDIQHKSSHCISIFLVTGCINKLVECTSDLIFLNLCAVVSQEYQQRKRKTSYVTMFMAGSSEKKEKNFFFKRKLEKLVLLSEFCTCYRYGRLAVCPSRSSDVEAVPLWRQCSHRDHQDHGFWWINFSTVMTFDIL